MQCITGYRTKLLPLARAERFARCLAANGRFTNVQVQESNRTKSADKRHFVYYTPRSVERGWALRDEAQDARQKRAEEQAHRYQFVLSDSGRFYYTLNVETGEVYETTVHDCDCPDKAYNLRRTGLQCKHSLMLECRLAEAAREAEIERQIEEMLEEEAAEEEARRGYEAAEEEARGLRAYEAEQSRLALARSRMSEDFPDF